MIRYAGVDLLLGNDDVGQCLSLAGIERSRLFPPAPAYRSDQRGGEQGPGQLRTPLPRHNWPDMPALAINQLYWPTGAGRFASFLALVSRTQLLEVLDVLGSGVNARDVKPQQLEIADTQFSGDIPPNTRAGDGTGLAALSVAMFALSPQPLAILWKSDDVTGEVPDDAWVLPLVDVRYWWQWSRLAHRIPATLLDTESRVPETTTTIRENWHGLLRLLRYSLDSRADVYSEDLDAQVSTADIESDDPLLRIRLQPEEIDTEAWFFPDRVEFDRPGHNAAELLDAAAHSIGRRVVREFNGDLTLIDPLESLERHRVELTSQNVIAGGMRILPTTTANETTDRLALGTIATKPFDLSGVMPEFIDVTFRKLVEYDDGRLPDDITDPDQVPSDFAGMQLLHGVGTRTIRVPSRLAGARNVVPRAVQTVITPAWVGRTWFAPDESREQWEITRDDGPCPGDPDPWETPLHDLVQIDNEGDTHSETARGSIDRDWYGDRYFWFAAAVAANRVAWESQQHIYRFSGFLPWRLSGFDDCLVIDAGNGSTRVASLPPGFGSDVMLTQLHRQGSFDPTSLVALLTSQWTLHPKTLERFDDPEIDSCDLQVEEGVWKEFPVRIDCLTQDRFPHTWQWAEIAVRPLIPTDPWAHRTSIEYGRAMCWAGDPITAISRSRKIIDALRAELLCDTVPTADAPDDCPTLGATDRTDCWQWDRTSSLPIASGVVYLRRYGEEWQIIETDCIPEGAP